MELRKYLDHLKENINKALDKRLPKAGVSPKIIHKAMRYSVFSGGKRIRPIILLESCRACCGKADKRPMSGAMAMACAVEMVHAYSLIHDDLPSMDDDDYRRGKLTSHKVFGEANAILAGDALLTLAFNVLANDLEPRTGIRAISELSGAIGTFGMVGGQVMDIEYKGKASIEKVKIEINALKTARLFEASAVMGALAAGASDKKIRAMASFGRSMGEAFQIVDDIMDKDPSGARHSGPAAKRRAGDINSKAKLALDTFGDKADTLRSIADMILKRSV